MNSIHFLKNIIAFDGHLTYKQFETLGEIALQMFSTEVHEEIEQSSQLKVVNLPNGRKIPIALNRTRIVWEVDNLDHLEGAETFRELLGHSHVLRISTTLYASASLEGLTVPDPPWVTLLANIISRDIPEQFKHGTSLLNQSRHYLAEMFKFLDRHFAVAEATESLDPLQMSEPFKVYNITGSCYPTLTTQLLTNQFATFLIAYIRANQTQLKRLFDELGINEVEGPTATERPLSAISSKSTKHDDSLKQIFSPIIFFVAFWSIGNLLQFSIDIRAKFCKFIVDEILEREQLQDPVLKGLLKSIRDADDSVCFSLYIFGL